MNKKFCRKNCRYLSPTEKEQSREKEDHVCNRYGARVFHLSHHPELIRLKECAL